MMQNYQCFKMAILFVHNFLKLFYRPNILCVSFRPSKSFRITLDHSNKSIKLTHKIICINSYTIVRSILSQTYIVFKKFWRWILISIQNPFSQDISTIFSTLTVSTLYEKSRENVDALLGLHFQNKFQPFWNTACVVQSLSRWLM